MCTYPEKMIHLEPAIRLVDGTQYGWHIYKYGEYVGQEPTIKLCRITLKYQRYIRKFKEQTSQARP